MIIPFQIVRRKVSAVCWRAAIGFSLLFCLSYPAFPQAQSSSKEYIRIGGRVVAIENQTIAISTASLPAVGVGTAYAPPNLAATGGAAPYIWSWAAATGSQLPPGVILSTSGAISGTPTSTGSFSVLLTVKDSAAVQLTTNKPFTINVVTGPTIGTTTLVDGTVQVAYSQTLTQSGGTAPYTWTVSSGSLSPGLTLTGATGVISGTPTTAGLSNFTVRVADANTLSATSNLSINVAGPLTINTTSLSGGTVGVSYNQAVTVGGGRTPYAWSVLSGALPVGLGLNLSTGAITGTPTTASANPVNFTIQVTDANSSAVSQALSITISTKPSITTTTLANGDVGSGYSQTLAVSGGKTPYVWSMASGPLPTGLTLTSSGTITGTPASAGPSSFTVLVTDANGNTDSKALSITVKTSLTIVTTALPGGTAFSSYSTIVVASGGQTPYTWAVTAGLPAGTALGSATGTISGTLPGAGTYTFTVTVTDATGATFSSPFSIAIGTLFTLSARGYVYAGQQDTISANQQATWALSGAGALSPLTLSSTSVYTAPASIATAQTAHITATAGTATATLDETLLPGIPTLNPSSGTYTAGTPVAFTMAGNHADNWSTVNDYLIMNISPDTSFQWTGSCVIEYQPATQTLYLWEDGHWGSAAISATTVLANGQCSIALPGNATQSGPNLAVRLNLTFSGSFTGAKTSWIADSTDGYVIHAYAQGTITITSAGSITVSPASANVAFGSGQQFSATVTGLSNTSVTWSINPQIGTISSTGLYSVPLPISDLRSVTVTATSQVNSTVTGQAPVTLILPTDLHLTSGNLPPGSLYEASNSITADTGFVVGSGKTVTFTAGGSIVLLPGFQAATGGLFHASVDPLVH